MDCDIVIFNILFHHQKESVSHNFGGEVATG